MLPDGNLVRTIWPLEPSVLEACILWRRSGLNLDCPLHICNVAKGSTRGNACETTVGLMQVKNPASSGGCGNGSSRPPAILLGGDTPIGLTVVRELGQENVPVHVIARSNRGLGLYSRWATTRHIRPVGKAQTIDLLNRIAETHGAHHVIGVSETDLVMLRNAADDNKLPGIRVLVPLIEQLQLVNDKLATYGAARKVGIPVPESWQPLTRREAEDIPRGITYPCILKWRDPVSVAGILREIEAPMLKAEYCYTRAELTAALSRYHPINKYPVVQAYARGVGLGHMIFMYKGEALLSFQHIRKAEWPPEGGISTVCSSLPPSFHPEWVAQSIGLLRHIGWQGAAMLEYRYDKQTDTRALMEINGRFWGSLPLAYHAGARFAWLTYSVLGLNEIPTIGEYRAGITCRYMIPEMRRVLRIIFNPRSIKDRTLTTSKAGAMTDCILGFFRPSIHYYIFSFNDPMPFVIDMKEMIYKGFGIIVTNARSVAVTRPLNYLRRIVVGLGKSICL